MPVYMNGSIDLKEIWITGKDGNQYKFTGLHLIDILPELPTPDDKKYIEFKHEPFEFYCTTKCKKGAIDYICGKMSMAAYRYVRSCKREQEKKRRMKLKGLL